MNANEIDILSEDWDTLVNVTRVLKRRCKNLEEVEKVNRFILSIKDEVVEEYKQKIGAIK